jgi:hypothetical protein
MNSHVKKERTTLVGYDVTLLMDLEDGTPFDITDLIEIDDETTGRGIHIDAGALFRAVAFEREVRRRVKELTEGTNE